MKLFFLGGSFDPPHLGHLAISEKCRDLFDIFLFIPARQSPTKLTQPAVTAAHRVKMLELMIDGLPNIFIDSYEINSNRPNYTISTIEYLQNKYPRAELTMLIGGDQAASFENWHNFMQIPKLTKIICFNRGGYLVEDFPKSIPIEIINDFRWEVSATDIRKSLKLKDKSMLSKLHPAVKEYILKNCLYR